MKKAISLKDIAAEVGVSIPLVSYVLGDKGKANRVSEKTEKKIKEVAKKLNYHPNLNARSLKTNKTRTLGVIVADISNPFFSHLARVIEDEAYAMDYTVIFGSSDEKKEKFDKVLSFLRTRQVDGFIIAAPDGTEESLNLLKQSNIPIVLIDRYFEAFDYVVVDNFKASYSATKLLIEQGNKRIATVMYDSSLNHYEDRYNGYLSAIKSEKNLQTYVCKLKYESTREDMREALENLIEKDRIDAVYFQTNTLAEEGLRQLFKMGKNVVQKIDIVAFDKNATYDFMENFIPYISQPIARMGKMALQILIEKIEGTGRGMSQFKYEVDLELQRKSKYQNSA